MNKFRSFLVVLAIVAGTLLAASPAQAVADMTMGSTFTPDSLFNGKVDAWSDYGRGPGRGIEVSRVFFRVEQGCPKLSDARIQKLWSRNVIPFVSFKLSGSAAPACISSMLAALPTNRKLWIANYHEGESKLSASTFIALQRADWAIVQPSAAHAQGRVKFMAIQTRQWTENNNQSYATYWCGCGDYFAVDMYVNSWEDAYPSVPDFFYQSAHFGNAVAHKPVFYPELGAIRMPSDPSDTQRASWMTAAGAYMKTNANIYGAIWWDAVGTGGRDFRLQDPDTIAAWQAVLATN